MSTIKAVDFPAEKLKVICIASGTTYPPRTTVLNVRRKNGVASDIKRRHTLPFKRDFRQRFPRPRGIPRRFRGQQWMLGRINAKLVVQDMREKVRQWLGVVDCEHGFDQLGSSVFIATATY